MDTPDKGIPQELLDGAECVAVFPSVFKAGFIFGGRGGRGVASCRTTAGWSAPAFFTLGGGSFGWQIGAQSTDFVMLFMNKDGLNSLLSDQFTLGGDASVAAGPVGRQAGAATDLKLNAKILSYSRSKGLFAGLELKGVVIKPDKDDMRDVYTRLLRPSRRALSRIRLAATLRAWLRNKTVVTKRRRTTAGFQAEPAGSSGIRRPTLICRDLLARQWLVTYRSSNTGSGFRRIEVTTEANLHLHYPAGYRVR
jgi:lipid-binding SYLF domain-containing protein